MLAFFIGGFMELKLYTVTDGDNVINKVKTLKTTMEINLKRDVDITSPTLLLIPNLPTGFNGINYAEIPALNRFYFVNSVNNISNNLWELVLSCDVVETYKADILASRARFYRNIKTGDYFAGVVDQSTIKTVTKHLSGVTIGNEKSMIITSVGEI